jgi:hypothetical protein
MSRFDDREKKNQPIPAMGMTPSAEPFPALKWVSEPAETRAA